MMFSRKVYRFDLLLILVVHITGIVGIRLLPEYFLKVSFVSIIIPLGLYFYRLKPKLFDILIILLVYVITFLSEWIGVNYGWLFGTYVYGDSLGFKIGGVPLLIGANWLLLALVSRQIAISFINNKWIVFLVSSLIMVFIDCLIEPLADQLNFWSWDNGIIPLSNYRDWFIIAFINQWILSYTKLNAHLFVWSFSYVLILVFFFSSFYL